MAQEEIYGTRCGAYSAWHRRHSARRFIGIEDAQTMSMIDLDAALYVEYDDRTKEPLILVETAREGRKEKSATVTRNLARACTDRLIPAFVLLYTVSDKPNPADPRQPDIAWFRWRLIWPETTPWIHMTPEWWCRFLRQMRVICSAQLDGAKSRADATEEIIRNCNAWHGVWKSHGDAAA